MKKPLVDIAARVVHQSKKRGATGSRVTVYRNHTAKLEWRDGKQDRFREYTNMGMEVSLFVDGRYTSNTTSDLRPKAIESFLSNAISMTRLLQKDPHWQLPDPIYYKGQYQGDLGVFDDSVEKITTDQLRQQAAAIERSARMIENANRIISVSTSSTAVHSQSATICSNGMQGYRESSIFSMSAQSAMRGNGGRKPEAYDYAVCCQKKHLPKAQQIGQKASQRAWMSIGEKSEPSGEYSCVIENRVLARLLRGLRYALDGRAIQQQKSFLADKLGQQILSPALTIVDQPHLIGGLGSSAFDDEGMATKKRTIFDKGVPKTLFLNTYYASKLGQKPTTGYPANVVFEHGKEDREQLIKNMDTGILITDFNGGNFNPATGDFSIGIRGQWIKGGKVVRPVAEMNLAGNHLTFWKKVAQVGSDPNLYSSWRCPSIRFEPIQFSGV